ncbi:diaminopimelate epimerase [Salinactinospora qingdaonensis]|uniref:Diaminopimelate epimerase n=1 Tax=Salinactinospora qingdaonensis TaxID=702744 RepID=A0ABP7G707_9ACTN
MRFAKGHGTENDFVILPDPDGELDLTPTMVAALCDRRAGIGADGVLRVVRTKALGVDLSPDARSAEHCEWFMDYRNADGSIAEMCGNGVRVFGRYLLDSGRVAAREFPVGTRAGARQVSVTGEGAITVDMGRVRLMGEGAAVVAGRRLRGQRVMVGNPHLACAVEQPIEEIDLTTAPSLDSEAFPEGGNVEVYRRVEPGVLQMRVYERGSGETRSCGTGIVATAAAATGDDSAASWTVRVPGGECTVEIDDDGARLTGPAVIVAEGSILPGALRY